MYDCTHDHSFWSFISGNHLKLCQWWARVLCTFSWWPVHQFYWLSAPSPPFLSYSVVRERHPLHFLLFMTLSAHIPGGSVKQEEGAPLSVQCAFRVWHGSWHTGMQESSWRMLTSVAFVAWPSLSLPLGKCLSCLAGHSNRPVLVHIFQKVSSHWQLQRSPSSFLVNFSSAWMW